MHFDSSHHKEKQNNLLTQDLYFFQSLFLFHQLSLFQFSFYKEDDQYGAYYKNDCNIQHTDHFLNLLFVSKEDCWFWFYNQ